MSNLKFEMTLDPKIHVVDIGKGTCNAASHDISPGVYTVCLNSNAMYHGSQYPVKKVVVYNTTDNEKYGWFYVVEQKRPITIKVTGEGAEAGKVFAFFVDILSGDNTGWAKLVFNPIEACAM
jgi:hypothetical protein